MRHAVFALGQQNMIYCRHSQSLDTAVQHCEEVLQSVIRVARDQTNWRESRDPHQLPIQLQPLLLRQQVSFIQHQEKPVCRKYCGKNRRKWKCWSVTNELTITPSGTEISIWSLLVAQVATYTLSPWITPQQLNNTGWSCTWATGVTINKLRSKQLSILISSYMYR